MIEIDGSIGEGGGQILRTAIALSAILGEDIRIINIRKNRPNPGLKAQHLHAVKAVAKIANARVNGLKLGSQELIFKPQKISAGQFTIDVGTAGSISLVLQALLPVLVFANNESKIEIIGGTDTKWAPPIDYLRFVFKRYLEYMGVDVSMDIIKRGHYPKGGGRVVVKTKPVGKLKSINVTDQGTIRNIKGISHAVKLPRHVAERQANEATKEIRKSLSPDINVEITIEHHINNMHLGPGSGIVLWTESDTLSVVGSDSLGERGKRAEKVGFEAAKQLINVIKKGAAIDFHMCDMLLPWLSLANGESQLLAPDMTLHAQTNIEIIKLFLGDIFSYHKTQNNNYLIKIKGRGI